MKEFLGEFVNIKTGKLDANVADINGVYPFFTCSNEPLKINNYSYDCECVLVAGNGDLNVKYYNGKFDAYQRTYIIESKNDKELNPKYLYYLINSNIEQLRKNSIGGVIKYIKLGNLTNIEFKNINIEEQKNIVKQLDKVQETIDIRKRQIEELDELIKSQFVEMFGDPILNDKNWNIKKCIELTNKIGSGATPDGGSKNYEENGISLIRSMNVYDSFFEYKDLAHIDNQQARKLDNVEVYEGDILLNITGASVTRTCVVPKEILPARVNQHVSIIRCNEFINNVYLNNLFINDTYKNFLLRIAVGGGGTREAITKHQLENLEIILPPIELQNKFADIVKQIDKQKLELQKNLEEMQKLQESLMNKYFN